MKKLIRPSRFPVQAPDPADSDLFRDAIGPVRPLRQPAAPPPQRPRPAPRARQFELDEARVRDELLTHSYDLGLIELGDELHYLKVGQPDSLLRKLRRGQFSIRAEIDLHEMSVAVARVAITDFLSDAIRNHEWCVRIVHGKGLRSRSGPVIKGLTDQMLRRRDDVLAFSSALPNQGGTGAVLVLLQRK